MSLFHPDEINRLVFKRLSELLQTLKPGWAEHNANVPPKAPTTTGGGSPQRTCSLSPIDNPLWDEKKEQRQGEVNVTQ